MKASLQTVQKWHLLLLGGTRRLVAACLFLCAALTSAPAQAEQERWHVWDQNLLQLSELIGGMHYLRRLCVDYRDQLWRWRMLDVLEWENAAGDRREAIISRFNQGYNGTRQWHDRCSASARLRIEHYDAMSSDILDWFAANEPI